MPVESEDTAECLEPERIGKASQHLLGTAVGNDVRRDLACELRHSREEPRAGARPECSGNERSQFDGACKQLRNFAVE
jgi:hypothetical protein